MAAIDKAVDLLNSVVEDYYMYDDTNGMTHLVQEIESWLIWYEKYKNPGDCECKIKAPYYDDYGVKKCWNCKLEIK